MTSRSLQASPLLLAVVLLAGLTVHGQPPTIEWTTVASGIEHTAFRHPAPAGGTWSVNALRVDMSRARLDVIRAGDVAVGLETVSSIAARTKALAAINGGYFRMTGEFKGDSTGTLQIDGVIMSEPDRARASVGIVREGDAARLVFGHVVWKATLTAGAETRSIDGVNRARGPDELVVFMPEFGASTLTDDTGIEVVVRNGRVDHVRDLAGGSVIPRDGLVVSARGAAREWAKQVLRTGSPVRVAMAFEPADPSEANPWERAEDVLGAGPLLVTDGVVNVTDAREKMIPTFATDLHPRTAIAALADGRALLLVADGRHPPERVGMSLPDLARLLIELGARDAINLDGGGSTTMVVGGRVVNAPSDPTGERPVSDAIIVRPR